MSVILWIDPHYINLVSVSRGLISSSQRLLFQIIRGRCAAQQPQYCLHIHAVKQLEHTRISIHTCTADLMCVHSVYTHAPTHKHSRDGGSLIIGNRFQLTYFIYSRSGLNFSPSLIKSGDGNQLRYWGWDRRSDWLCHLIGALLPLSL